MDFAGNYFLKTFIIFVENQWIMNDATNVLATRSDISDLEIRMEKRFTDNTKAIYIVGLVKFIAIVGSVLAIVNFMLK